MSITNPNEITVKLVNENFYEIDGKLYRNDGYCGYLMNGYSYIYLNRKIYPSHRILWVLYNQTEIPKGYFIDHIDGDHFNNSKENLRLATRSQNQHNRKINTKHKTAIKGITPIRSGKYSYYRAQICVNYERYTKHFPFTPEGLESAKLWLEEIRKELHGEFSKN